MVVRGVAIAAYQDEAGREEGKLFSSHRDTCQLRTKRRRFNNGNVSKSVSSSNIFDLSEHLPVAQKSDDAKFARVRVLLVSGRM